MKLVLLLCVWVVVAVTGEGDSDMDYYWNLFKKYHSKMYDTDQDEVYRRAVWESNLKHIQRHNVEADMNMHTYTLGMNQYGDLTDAEYKQFLLGYRPSNGTRAAAHFIPPLNVELPDEVDWRKKGYVTPVKDQKACGSCWAFSTTGSLEGQHFRKTHKLVSLSEQNLVDCSTKEGNHGCGGGLMDNGFQYVEDSNGLDTERSYPYLAKEGKCHFKSSDVGATCTGFTDIKRDDEDDLKSAVGTVGPVSVAIDAGHTSFRFYKQGVYSEPKCSPRMLDHGVLAVGYGTYQGQDYWLVKNSWNTTWGNEGYIMMARNMDNMCGIASQASYPLV